MHTDEGPNKNFFNSDKYSLLMCKKLKFINFFKRFSNDTLIKYMRFGEVKYFNINNIIFPNNRVGVITNGSVRVISHK